MSDSNPNTTSLKKPLLTAQNNDIEEGQNSNNNGPTNSPAPQPNYLLNCNGFCEDCKNLLFCCACWTWCCLACCKCCICGVSDDRDHR